MPADYVNEQAARNITLHSLRHTFVSLSRLAGLADVEVQAMSGHKTLEMLGVYTHAKQVTQLDVCRNVFEQTFKNNTKDFADNVDGVDKFSYMI
ncbi:MAG: tyrosine-type recombinase/integrase [Spirochaetaceae bacterium]|jgi:integrase|nr:tyrosine-type recombinase/integrase [Spirochaetaceae bacterium]